MNDDSTRFGGCWPVHAGGPRARWVRGRHAGRRADA